MGGGLWGGPGGIDCRGQPGDNHCYQSTRGCHPEEGVGGVGGMHRVFRYMIIYQLLLWYVKPWKTAVTARWRRYNTTNKYYRMSDNTRAASILHIFIFVML